MPRKDGRPHARVGPVQPQFDRAADPEGQRDGRGGVGDEKNRCDHGRAPTVVEQVVSGVTNYFVELTCGTSRTDPLRCGSVSFCAAAAARASRSRWDAPADTAAATG